MMTTLHEPDLTLSTMEVAEMVGLSYRMIDYFLREGHITLACDRHPGSGRRRVWTQDEVTAFRLFTSRYFLLLEQQEEFRSGRVWEQAVRESEADSAA